MQKEKSGMLVLNIYNIQSSFCRLFICARSQKKLEEVAAKCREYGSQCEFAVCDVTQEEQCK